MSTHNDAPRSGVVGGFVLAGPFTSLSELAAALGTLEPMVRDLAPHRRPAVEAALRKLIEAAKTDAVPTKWVTVAADIVAGAAPQLRRRLEYITEQIALSLTVTNVFWGLETALGVPGRDSA